MVVASVMPLALIASAGADPTPANTGALVAPSNLPGVPAMPFTGATAAAFTIPVTTGALSVTPYQGVQGTPISITESGLPASTSVELTWGTSTATWLADVEPNTVNYLGASYAKVTLVMATVMTDANGNLSYQTTVPADFGGVHDIYAVVDGAALGHAGFEELRILSVTPRSGPIGTPITITYTSMGASLYTGGAQVTWDNHYLGEMMAQWTRGTASVTIRATGPVGTHYIQVGNAISYMYLNVVQSPIPYTNGGTVAFRVTKDDGPPAPSITWPAQVAPTVSQVTTLSAANLDPKSTATGTLDPTSGPNMTKTTLKVTGLSFNGSATLVLSTVVGNRVNCLSTCWAFVTAPLGTVTVANGALDQQVTIPDKTLGGWHVIQVLNGSTVEAQVPFYVSENIVPFYDKAGKLLTMGVERPNNKATDAAITAGGSAATQVGTPTYKFKAGQEVTLSIKGVGWTQLDNTLGVDYDNSYIGYSCGFNTNGYMVVHLKATGAPGTHIIDLYPMLYSLSPSYANTPYGMVPDLSSGRDYPGLALGYQVPIIHFAITIVK
ncbi:MAG: hypothetical protein ACRDV0_05120 [Acidimicrobiales bacterium]